MNNKKLFLRKILILRWEVDSPYLSLDLLRNFLDWFESRFDMIFAVFLNNTFPKKNFLEKLWPYPIISDHEIEMIASTEESDVVILSFTPPDKFYLNNSSKNIGFFTWNAPMPEDRSWVTRMNLMEEIWTSALFLEEFLKKEDVTVPVRYIPCPIRALGGFNNSSRPERLSSSILLRSFSLVPGIIEEESSLESVRRLNKLLFCGKIELNPRKGLPLLIEEWLRSREREKDSALVLIPSEMVPISDQLNFLRRLLFSISSQHELETSNIFVCIDSEVSSILTPLAIQCDAFVTFSFGELLLGEILNVLSIGRPIICPRNSVFSEFFKPDYPYFLRTENENFCFSGSDESVPVSARWGVPFEDSFGEIHEMLKTHVPSGQSTSEALSAYARIVEQIDSSLADIKL